MELKTFLKSTEAIVVLVGLFLTLTLGKLFAILTAIVYVLLNVPDLWTWIKSKFQ